ncbi:LacI family DNA-binding transcriptional regulator [Dubosiella newyorkensis]|uniref:LacI family DNA-binding transcriptional regulator n=1 Tax=Dubosiella newyorkensis TaxID=1862672 RepID=UPI002572E532|nr:LacI family DNA-binding transcriptional regulator [Dubosiella newyorkensis]
MKVTIAQIAKEAGVSPGSVSNALNNRKGAISPKKREEIIEVATRLGYFKKGKRTGVITLVLYEAGEDIVHGEQPFFSALIKGIEEACYKNEYQLRIRTVKNNDRKAIQDLDDVSMSDGLLIIGTEMHFKDVEQFKHFKIPFVIVDNAYIMENCDFVAINNKDGMYEITKYLIDQGYKRIGLLNSWSTINNFKERKFGFLQALEDNDILFDPNDEVFLESDIHGSEQEMRQYLQQQKQLHISLPEAYVCMNDYIALGAIRAMKAFDVKIAIAGFDDIEFAQYNDPPLTTVQVKKDILGATAVERLLRLFDGDEQSLKILVNTNVIKRESA